MLRPTPDAGFPEPFALVRSSPRHFISTAVWIGVAFTMLWVAATFYVQALSPLAMFSALALAGWAIARVRHSFRLLGEDRNLLVLDAGGITAPRLFAGSVPWSAVQGALCGTVRGARILRLFVDANALKRLKFRDLSNHRHDRFDLTFSVLWLTKSLDHAAKSDVELAAYACNEWVAAEAARFAVDDPAVEKARKFAETTRSLIASPSRSSKAELALAAPAGLALAIAVIWTVAAFLPG
jgi:hypothetical protein